MIDSNEYIKRIIAQRDASLHQLAVTECLLQEANAKIAELEEKAKVVPFTQDGAPIFHHAV